MPHQHFLFIFLITIMANTQFFNNHTLVDFNKISNGDSIEINRLQNEFETNGWCFIRFPDENNQVVDKLDEVQKTLSNFFIHNEMDKLQYKTSNPFGYSRVGHKEGIKVLVDQHGSLENYHHPFTNDIEQTLQYLATLCNNLINIIKSTIFQMPVLAQSSTKEQVVLSELGMLDIVHYFNERTGPVEQPKVGLNTNEVNCVPHFDPGLFSLSILSTCDGLQLQDRLESKWIDGPINSKYDQYSIGVIWLGEAASILTQNRFKSGIHRVVYPHIPHTPRLTIWQEVCTMSQIETLLQQNEKPIVIPNNTTIQMTNQSNLNVSDLQIHSKNQENNSNLLPAGASVTMTNQPDSVPFLILSQGETLNNFMTRVENERGLSMSKSGIEHVQIKFPTTKNKTKDPSNNKGSFFSRFFKR